MHARIRGSNSPTADEVTNTAARVDGLRMLAFYTGELKLSRGSHVLSLVSVLGSFGTPFDC